MKFVTDFLECEVLWGGDLFEILRFFCLNFEAFSIRGSMSSLFYSFKVFEMKLFWTSVVLMRGWGTVREFLRVLSVWPDHVSGMMDLMLLGTGKFVWCSLWTLRNLWTYHRACGEFKLRLNPINESPDAHILHRFGWLLVELLQPVIARTIHYTTCKKNHELLRCTQFGAVLAIYWQTDGDGENRRVD